MTAGVLFSLLLGVSAALPAEAEVKSQNDAEAGRNQRRSIAARTSEMLESAAVQWTEPGFRLMLALGHEELYAASPASDASSTFFAIHPSWRLTDRWGLFGSIRYTIVTGRYIGVRWSATVEPTYHIGGWAFGVGGGIAGIWAGTNRSGYGMYAEGPVDSAAIQQRPLDNCDGLGPIAGGRIVYLLALGELFSFGGSLHGDIQFTNCEDRYVQVQTTVSDPNSRPTQWWIHSSVGGSVLLAWR